MPPQPPVASMLNLPPHPGTTGFLLLALGAGGGIAVLVLARGQVGKKLAAGGDRTLTWIVTAALAVSAAGAPFTLWRVVSDIRAMAPITAEHARYVGAETKLIDGELVERVAALIPESATYYVEVAPTAYSEIREALALWMGYALAPRRRTRSSRSADWIVTWGAPPARLGLRTAAPRLVGRNRLVEQEPVFVAEMLP